MKALLRALLTVSVCLAVLAFCLNALAADKTQITTAKNGITIRATAPAKTTAQTAKTADEAPAVGTVVYNNFAFDYAKARYWCCYGGLLAGPNSPYGQQHQTAVWQATAFTPTTNITVTSVKLGVAYQSGSFTDVIVTINADDGGVPGSVLSTWKVKKMPVFGSCCQIKTNSLPNGGVAVTAGTQYWIVVGTEADSDFQGAWNFDSFDQIDAIPNAYYYAGSWYTFEASMNFAFAVYGQ